MSAVILWVCPGIKRDVFPVYKLRTRSFENFFFSFEKTKIVDFFNSITAPSLGETFYSLNLRKGCPLKTVMYFTRRYLFKDDHYRANLTKWLFSSNMLIFLKYNIHYIHSSNELPCFRFFLNLFTRYHGLYGDFSMHTFWGTLYCICLLIAPFLFLKSLTKSNLNYD